MNKKINILFISFLYHDLLTRKHNNLYAIGTTMSQW